MSSDLTLQILEKIKESRQILLHFHPSPDPDSIGSVLAMAQVLKKLGKDFTIISGDSEIPKYVGILPNSKLIKSLNYTQIKPEDYDLFIILDSSSTNQITKLKEITFPDTMTTIVIDHHQTNLKFGTYNVVDSSSPAASQILFDLLADWAVKIDPEMALCLYFGIYADTGGFKYPNTTYKTLEIASKLAKINPDFPKVIFEMENSRVPENLYYAGLAYSSLENYFGGKVVISAIPYKELTKRGIKKEHTEKMEISNNLKSVIGWEIGISFIEIEPENINVSFRTRQPDLYDLSKIASSVGKGGGHKAAAGTSIYAPFDETKKQLLEAIAKVYPSLGKA
jgi:bifunctional oligoribonuclease and PAP phosphatase NrnA